MNGNVLSSPPMEISFQTIGRIVTRIVVDTVRVGNDQYVTILYAGTHDGQVLKLVQKRKGDKFVLLTIWSLEELNQDKSPIRNMILAQVKYLKY